ncbi:GMP/IMP nucleotidase [Marinobacter sp. X15-166B]|uniref:GMP/IMP nucleotidase n=1 Tax=Marinobacter sp. X15-166B TaxID=1897620 RepID=UPI00085CBFBF|nr:GMP/IMP nucleotidase [Marinobacter sp. X15-166B]OEY65844.1 haloacid dehalogenase [Marinobacter sp. X15-166B]
MIHWHSLDTVFLDMDGTLLDLHFDNHFWLEHLPRRYAETHALSPDAAKQKLMAMINAQKGSLNWYCTDYWSEQLALDVNALKAEVSDRIGYRPHVHSFLESVRGAGLRSIIVTNCHPDPLALKLALTGLEGHVDSIISSHELGYPKEAGEFWRRLQGRHRYDPARTLMVDDSLPVLESAIRAGIGQCLMITAPDSKKPAVSAHPVIPSIRHFDEIPAGALARPAAPVTH